MKNCKTKRNTFTLLLTLLAVTAFSLPAFAAKSITVPAKIISPNTVLVVHINTDALTLDKVKATAHVFIDAIPDVSKDLRQKLSDKLDKQLSKTSDTYEAAKALQKHIHEVIVSVTPPVKNKNKGKSNKSAAPPDTTRSLVLVRANDSDNAQSLTKVFKKANDIAGHKKEQTPKVTHITGNWYLVQDQRNGKIAKSSIVPDNAGDVAAAQKFIKVLDKDSSAHISLAIVSNKQMKKAFDKDSQGQSPQAKLSKSMQSMQSSLLTVHLGTSPDINIKTVFSDANSAKSAAQAFNQILTRGKGMAMMMLGGGKNPPSSDLLDDIFNALKPSVSGNTLTIDLNKKFVQDIAKLVPSIEPMVKSIIKSKFGSSHSQA